MATVPLPISGGAFTHMDSGGIAFYSLPQTGIGIFPVQVTLGLTPKCVVAALGPDAIKEAADRWAKPAAGLEGTEAYKKAAALVYEPTESFAYVDSKAVFERAYGLFRGVATLGILPRLSDYIDVSKLPQPETISRHLSPIVSSEGVVDGGELMESAGPITSIEAIAAVVASAAIAAVDQHLKGQDVTLPSIPGLFAPPAGNPPVNSWTTPLAQGGSNANSGSRPAPAVTGSGAAASPSAGTP